MKYKMESINYKWIWIIMIIIIMIMINVWKEEKGREIEINKLEKVRNEAKGGERSEKEYNIWR